MFIKDFTINTYKKSLEDEFTVLAHDLINEHVLQSPKNTYWLAEIEFYYYHPKFHPDTDTHCNEKQLESLTWYFHRRGKDNNIIKYNRKGLDITFGDNIEAFGGILIRAIQNVEDLNDYIYGPSTVIDRLLTDCNLSIDSIENIEKESIPHNSYMTLSKRKEGTDAIYNCPRWGLGNKMNNTYKKKPYRYFIMPEKMHKGKEITIIPYLIERFGIERTLEIFNRKTFNSYG